MEKISPKDLPITKKVWRDRMIKPFLTSTHLAVVHPPLSSICFGSSTFFSSQITNLKVHYLVREENEKTT